MLEIELAGIEDISTIQRLSQVVWPVTFADILSPDQIKYMMEMMYSTESLKQQIENDHRYVLVKEDNNYLGYLSTEYFKEESYTKIHKIYVLPDVQGKGVGKALINYAKKQAQEDGSSSLWLNVNRYNKALQFYQHLGFSIRNTEDIDIGNGFLMEDYMLEMKL